MKAQTSSSHLLARMRSWALSRLALLDGNQSGAVAILCLAACMILFMTALVLYDAGHSARNKIDAQNAADTAAYSQAAVKARTMNMIMYTNVAKRSIVNLHNMYFGMWTAWVAWTAKRCKKAKKCKCLGCPSACKDCVENSILFVQEMFSDTIRFFGSAGSLAKDEIEALDKYQDYMTSLTPWWAWSEGLVRGSRNGASFTSSFPPPPGLTLTYLPNWINAAMNFLNMGSLYNMTNEVDGIPVRRASWLDMCMLPVISSGFTEVGRMEFIGNMFLHQHRSQKGAAKWSNVFKGAALATTVGCGYSRLRFGGNMVPREPIASGNSAKALMAKSNIVFSYKMAPETRGHLRQNFNILPQNYQVPPNFLERGSGFWTLSRGEFFFSKDAGRMSGNKPDPFKPQWTAKIRPVALPGEFEELGADINAMFHDVAPYMALASLLAVGQNALNGGDMVGGVQAIVGDAIYLEKATRSLDNGVINGLNK